MSASNIQRRSDMKPWNTENLIQAIKAVCNKEMGYLAAAKKFKLPRSTLYDCICSNWDPFQATQSKLGRKPNIPPALEEKLVEYLLLIERTYFGCTRDDVRRLDFQLVVQNEIPNPFSIAKEVANKDCFKRCMKLHSDKLSLRQSTGTSTARATGLSKEQVGIFFYLYEKELAAHDYPPSRGEFRSRQTRQLPRAVDLKGRLLSCQSY